MAESENGVAILNGVVVRVLKGEGHFLSNQPTQYAVESGKTISDHVVMTPNIVDVRFEMTNSDDRGANKARNVFQAIAKLMDERQLVELITEHAKYKNMVIANFSPDHRAPYKGAYAAVLRLQQVGIIGEASMVSAAGGRSASVLAKDGTDKTASAGQAFGQVQPDTNEARLETCMAGLAAESTRRAA